MTRESHLDAAKLVDMVDQSDESILDPDDSAIGDVLHKVYNIGPHISIMTYDMKKVAGALLFFGCVQFLLLLTIAETLYPGYSVSNNAISDLGVCPETASIFNPSVFLLGAIAVICAYFVQRVYNFKLFSVFIVLMGIGAMGVGLFPECECGDLDPCELVDPCERSDPCEPVDSSEHDHINPIHIIAALIAFLFGGLSAIVSYKLLNPPFSFFSVLLGVLSLVAIVLLVSEIYLGLGFGGMERMIAYPVLLWGVGFGGYLMSSGK